MTQTGVAEEFEAAVADYAHCAGPRRANLPRCA